MSAEDLVDAAIAGLTLGEQLTAPGLADPKRWDIFLDARKAFFDGLVAGKPAARYAA